jgi:hypothetical protein
MFAGCVNAIIHFIPLSVSLARSLARTLQRLNQDICNLSTLCTENNEKKVDKEGILAALRVWQESGNLPEDEIVSHVVAACNEVGLAEFSLRSNFSRN